MGIAGIIVSLNISYNSRWTRKSGITLKLIFTNKIPNM